MQWRDKSQRSWTFYPRTAESYDRGGVTDWKGFVWLKRLNQLIWSRWFSHFHRSSKKFWKFVKQICWQIPCGSLATNLLFLQLGRSQLLQQLLLVGWPEWHGGEQAAKRGTSCHPLEQANTHKRSLYFQSTNHFKNPATLPSSFIVFFRCRYLKQWVLVWNGYDGRIYISSAFHLADRAFQPARVLVQKTTEEQKNWSASSFSLSPALFRQLWQLTHNNCSQSQYDKPF